MDTDSIQISALTPVEVEFKFYIQDLHGKKHPAIIRYQYPLYFKEYFSRVESILANTVLREFKPRLSIDTLYCLRKKRQVFKSIRGFKFWSNFLISFNPDLSSLSVDEVETLSKEGFLKAVTVLLPLYVQYDGELCDLIIPFQNYDYPLCGEWDDIIHELLNLHKLVNNELPNRDFEHLWNEAFSFYSSICIVDAIVVPENYIIPTCRSSELILEFKQYKNIPGTTKTYRIDAANTNTNTQKHIHVYFDGEQLYAINVDGTPHDGSKYKLSKKDQAFLRDMGFVVPENGILEMYSFKDKPNT